MRDMLAAVFTYVIMGAVVLALFFGLYYGLDWLENQRCFNAGAQLGVKTVNIDNECYVFGEKPIPIDVYKWQIGIR